MPNSHKNKADVVTFKKALVFFSSSKALVYFYKNTDILGITEDVSIDVRNPTLLELEEAKSQ